jgi:hypothetical protein
MERGSFNAEMRRRREFEQTNQGFVCSIINRFPPLYIANGGNRGFMGIILNRKERKERKTAVTVDLWE